MDHGACGIVILEDEPFFRDLLVRALGTQAGLDVLAACGDEAAFLAAVAEHRPDVVVTDLVLDPASLQRGAGLAAAFQARSLGGGCGIVVLSNHAEPALLARVPRQDLVGFAYLLKGTTADIGTLVRAIEVAATGGTMVDPEITAERTAPEALSAHQVRVMRMVAAGASNHAIAESIGTTTKSVEHAITAILQQLGIDSGDRQVNARVAATLAFLGL